MLVYAYADTEYKRLAIEKAAANGIETPISINPERFTVNNELDLKRLSGLI